MFFFMQASDYKNKFFVALSAIYDTFWHINK